MSMDAGLHPLASCEAGKKKKKRQAAAREQEGAGTGARNGYKW